MHIWLTCCTTAKYANCEEEKIAKGNDDFLALVLWYYRALHQYRDKFDLKIKLRYQIGLFKSWETKLTLRAKLKDQSAYFATLIYLRNCVSVWIHLAIWTPSFTVHQSSPRDSCSSIQKKTQQDVLILASLCIRINQNHKRGNKRKLMDHRAVCLFQKEIKRKKN